MENINGKIQLTGLLSGLFGKLSAREQEILKFRYQLEADLDKRATLKKIGDMYNITRERVRQIEKDAIRKLGELAQEQDFSSELAALEADLSAYLEQRGGLSREDHLLENFVMPKYTLDKYHANAYLFLVEHLFDGVDNVDEHDYFYNVWKLSDIDLDKVAELIRSLETKLSADKRLWDKDELIAEIKNYVSGDLRSALGKYLGKHEGLTMESFLENYLHATSKVESNILNQWGLSHWEDVRPKKLSDKIFLVFAKETKPMHFREIAERINGAGFDHKKICAATVHNELIANDRYVLIGRGIYANKDWGFSAGTVADVIYNVLKEAGKPMTKDEIFNKVLEQRQVNKSTIYLTLINKDRFLKAGRGLFTVNQ